MAYQEEVKCALLGVDPGPVITARCARQMAEGVITLLDADVGVSTTGVGGPGPREGRPQGTVFITVATREDTTVQEYRFSGDPSEIVEQATEQALRDLAAVLAREHQRA